MVAQAIALPSDATEIRAVELGGALHVVATLPTVGWDELDAEPPTTAAPRLVRDDVARALFPARIVAAAPLDGPWRKFEGPKYDPQRVARAKPPWRSEGAVRVGDGLYVVLTRR